MNVARKLYAEQPGTCLTSSVNCARNGRQDTIDKAQLDSLKNRDVNFQHRLNNVRTNQSEHAKRDMSILSVKQIIGHFGCQ